MEAKRDSMLDFLFCKATSEVSQDNFECTSHAGKTYTLPRTCGSTADSKRVRMALPLGSFPGLAISKIEFLDSLGGQGRSGELHELVPALRPPRI